MRELIEIYTDLWNWTKDAWRNDRKEFWELYGGMTLLVFVFWFLFWVVLPIVEPYPY